MKTKDILLIPFIPIILVITMIQILIKPINFAKDIKWTQKYKEIDKEEENFIDEIIKNAEWLQDNK